MGARRRARQRRWGDNMLGAIGTGNIAPGSLTISLGTSGTLYTFSETPVIDPRGGISAFCDSTDHWLPLACTMNVASVVSIGSELCLDGTCVRLSWASGMRNRVGAACFFALSARRTAARSTEWLGCIAWIELGKHEPRRYRTSFDRRHRRWVGARRETLRGTGPAGGGIARDGGRGGRVPWCDRSWPM
jgi:hypothetical protein